MNTFMQNLFNTILSKNTISPNCLNDLDIKVHKINDEVLLLLTISNNTSEFYVYQGRGENFQEAIMSALKTFNQNSSHSTFEPKALRLDIVNHIRPAKKNEPIVDIQTDQILYTRGIDGLAIGKDLEVLLLPEEVIMFQLIKKQALQVTDILNSLKNHFLSSRDNKLISSIKNSSILEIYKIRTTSYYIDENNKYLLYRGHRLFSELSKKEIKEAIILTKDNYFKQIVNQKGKFIYSYRPVEDQKEKKYNILRHAGTIYSILETYEFIPDQKLLKIAKSAINYLLKKVKSFKINGKSVNTVIEKDAIKLGGNALFIIALGKFIQVTGDYQYLPLMKGMATWIREIQNEDGHFTVHKQQFSAGNFCEFISEYYPGEAMLALVRLYQIDGNEAWLDTAERSAQYLIKIRDKDANIYTIAHDHWLLYALNELYRVRPQQLYLNHALFISNAIMKSQIITDYDYIDWRGAYRLPFARLESTPTACRSEGLCAVYHLAHDFGFEEEATKIRKAIHEGIRFQLQTQLRPESVIFYKKKDLCLGAFQRGLMQYDLRIDFTQHNISSLIAYYKILSDFK